eukprot:497780_1
MAETSLEHKQQNDDNSIKFILKCKNTCRNHGLSLIPNSNSRLCNIVKIVTDQKGGHRGVTPHMHLIFPFLPKEVFANAYQIVNHCIKDIEPFIVSFNDISRTHGTGKQYCYLVCDPYSKQKLIELQTNIMNGLCIALKNGNIGNNIENKNIKNGKKNKKKNKMKKMEVENDKCCLENDIRNIEFNPHLTLGQWDEKEHKTIRNMILSAFKETENENKNDSDANDTIEMEQKLFQSILKFKVDCVHMVNVRRGKHRIVKTIPLKSVENK